MSSPLARGDDSQKNSMLHGLQRWHVMPVVTIGDSLPSLNVDGRKSLYQPVGVMDGLGVYRLDDKIVRVLVNHELIKHAGYSYRLRNGVALKGSRISFFDLERNSREVVSSGLAFDMVYDRQGQLVTRGQQIDQAHDGLAGFSRFCSAQLVERGQYGFLDTIFFTHEEVTDPIFHPHGGSLWALDTVSRRLHAVPAAGRMSLENTAALAIGEDRVALLIADDSAPQTIEPKEFGQFATIGTSPSHIVAAPLWLFIGKKNASIFDIRQTLPPGVFVPTNDFLNRNGLLVGDLYYFVPKKGHPATHEFYGSGKQLSGDWKLIEVWDSTKAKQPGYDDWGYKDGFTLRREAKAGGAFQFSRPEDLDTHPTVGTRAVVASTGRDTVFPRDAWGTIYQVDLDFDPMSATLTILYDGDEAGGGQTAGSDFGIRNPDNLDWSSDGFIYVQEAEAKSLAPLFGNQSGREASVWQLDPQNGTIKRVAEIDRSVKLLGRATDSHAGKIGAWESSGILDVTQFFETKPGEKLFLATIQAHSVRDGLIAESNLVEGGQLVWLSHQGH